MMKKYSDLPNDSRAAQQTEVDARMLRLMRPVLLMTLLASLSFAGPKLAPDLPSDANAMVDVIIQFKTPPTKQELKQLGAYGRMKKVFQNINGANLQLPMSLVQALENDPNVAYVSPNRTSTGMLDIVTATVNANAAWQYGLDGTGVGVVVIDSGITPKDDLMRADGVTSRIVYSESFIGVADTTDAYGHGTHVAGIVGGNGTDTTGPGFSRTYKGLAPNVNLINLRVLDQNGAGQEANVIAAIDRAIQLKNTYNIRVINLSLGHAIYESYTLDPLCQEVEAAWKAGIVVVTAAGNYGRDNSRGTHGYGTIISPANDPYVITVGATKTNGTSSRLDDSVASYSAKGPTLIDHIVKPDLVAPGNGVVSLLASPNCTLIQNFPRTAVSSNSYETWGTYSTSVPNYFRLSGTSMATPAVSGAAALLLQQQPFLTPDQVKARLMKTAWKGLSKFSSGTDAISFTTFNSEDDIFTVGAGYLDVQAALASTDVVSLPALSPTAVYDPLSKTVTIVRDFSVIWGDSYLWRDSVVWGTAIFSSLTSKGYSVVWGDSIGAGFSVVWGDCTSGGFSVVWGSSIGANTAMQAFSADDGDE
jgi:serine protease AprX